jgi:hypothetical protein
VITEEIAHKFGGNHEQIQRKLRVILEATF